VIAKHLSSGSRPALSLLEVLIALAVLLFALIGIGRLITLGGDQALEVEARSQAVELCRSKLDEVACGAVPLSSQSGVAFDEDPEWTWSLDAEQGAVAGLWNVTVTVSRDNPGGGKTQCALNQIVLDPSQIGTAYDAAIIASASQSSSSSSGNSSSGSTASSGAASGGAAAAGGAAVGTTKATGGATTGAAAKSGGAAPAAGKSTGATKGG
jgi:hypothetical protein